MTRHEAGKGKREVGTSRTSINVPYPTTGPQTGTGRKAVGRKPHRAEIKQRTATGAVLRALTERLWG